RQIAAEAGLSVPGLYHHYESKGAILEALCELAMDELLTASRRAMQAGTTTLERFDHLISCLVQFHAEHGDIAFVTYSEIRSLPDDARERHLQARREEQAMVTGLVEQGVAEGLFATPHPRESALAIGTLCVGISQWYRADGPLTVPELIDVYLDLCKDTARIVR
ncbi:MAG: TetR/AcrR family transcriptional regulator, partial [Leucobacter sp.]|nr:TetR/AcrR family transcriptional regulator [Leucobacter sp.]